MMFHKYALYIGEFVSQDIYQPIHDNLVTAIPIKRKHILTDRGSSAYTDQSNLSDSEFHIECGLVTPIVECDFAKGTNPISYSAR